MKEDTESLISQGYTRMLLKDLKEQIKNDFGDHCPDESSLCARCIVWKAFDTIEELYED